MAFDLPTTITFDWPSVVECAERKTPDMPKNVPEVGQSGDDFIRNYRAGKDWEMRVHQIMQCQMALSAWIAGWEAGRAGKPKDPTAK